MIARILVALDGSPRAPGVLQVAYELAERLGARLILFRALVIPPEFPAAAAGSLKDPLPAVLAAQAREELRQLAVGRAKIEIEPPVVGVGQPWRAILQAAERLDVDLIVLGSHGYSGVDRLLGTTAGRVANQATRHVLVVHGLEPAQEGTHARTKSGAHALGRDPGPSQHGLESPGRSPGEGGPA